MTRGAWALLPSPAALLRFLSAALLVARRLAGECESCASLARLHRGTESGPRGGGERASERAHLALSPTPATPLVYLRRRTVHLFPFRALLFYPPLEGPSPASPTRLFKGDARTALFRGKRLRRRALIEGIALGDGRQEVSDDFGLNFQRNFK